MSVWKKRDESIDSIESLSTKSTKMTVAMLMSDKTKYEYAGLSDAVGLFFKHVANGDKIVIHGDYDTDGIMSLSIFKMLFRAMKLKDAVLYAPCRFKDGYGLKDSHVEAYADDKCGLLITVDNGIAALSSVEIAKAHHMDVIILDHHEPVMIDGNMHLPRANVVIDPHVTTADFDDLCGAGISLMFVREVMRKIPYLSISAKKELYGWMKAYAAVGTVGDVVSLRCHNRVIVQEGLDVINKHLCSTGLSVLLDTLSVEYVDADTIAYTISPVINASGRLYEDGATFVLNILTATEDSEDLRSRCQELIKRNEERKTKTEEILTEAEVLMESHKDDNVIVLVPKGSLIGIAGLVAGKLTEEYHRPAIVLAEVNGILKGSGRSTKEFDIKGGLDKCAKYLLSYGGHPMAAGLSLEKDNLQEFTQALNAIAPEIQSSEEDVVWYDLESSIDQTRNIIQTQNLFAPFGASNPKPQFLFRDVMIDKSKNMGMENQHLKLFANDVNLVWFGHAADYAALGSPNKVDVIATVAINLWRGNVAIQLLVEDLRPSG